MGVPFVVLWLETSKRIFSRHSSKSWNPATCKVRTTLDDQLRCCKALPASAGMTVTGELLEDGTSISNGIGSMGRERLPCVYILASKRNGTLYVGVTSNLVGRVWQHRTDAVEGFTRRYHVHDLVWFEMHETMASAITREKAIKAWRRSWKLELIEKSNPYWRDLYTEIL
jgi:putative endonuclease